MDEVLNDLDITQNGDKWTFNSPTDWTQSSNSGVYSYTEYTKAVDGEQITLLIQTTILQNNAT